MIIYFNYNTLAIPVCLARQQSALRVYLLGSLRFGWSELDCHIFFGNGREVSESQGRKGASSLGRRQQQLVCTIVKINEAFQNSSIPVKLPRRLAWTFAGRNGFAENWTAQLARQIPIFAPTPVPKIQPKAPPTRRRKIAPIGDLFRRKYDTIKIFPLIIV